MKIRVARLVLNRWWYANCPACPTGSGFYTAPPGRSWLCMVWAREHVKQHQHLTCIEEPA